MDDISPIEKEDIENKIIDWIDMGASSRLIIFKPKNGKQGADLAIKKKGEYKGKEIYLQINSSATPIMGQDFTRDVPWDSFAADKSFYLMFVYFDEIKQDISSYFWIVPSLFFKDAVEPEKINGKSVMRFSAPTDIKKQNKYSKFLVNKKDLGKLFLKIIESKEEYEFSGQGVKIINLENLKKFISEARENTYAGDGVPADDPRLTGSFQFEFQKADYFYRDIYFAGENNFIGQEIIYQNNKPVWGMNYFGNNPDKEATIFLKQSLFEMSQECRFGQACEFEKSGLKYEDHGQGNMENFSGKEQIAKKEKIIYSLTYHGGLI